MSMTAEKPAPDEEPEKTPADEAYCSDIPAEAKENVVSFYTEDENARQQGGNIHYERREYILDGELVGYRQFDHDGRLIIETPMKDMRKHGTEWSGNGNSAFGVEAHRECRQKAVHRNTERNDATQLAMRATSGAARTPLATPPDRPQTGAG